VKERKFKGDAPPSFCRVADKPARKLFGFFSQQAYDDAVEQNRRGTKVSFIDGTKRVRPLCSVYLTPDGQRVKVNLVQESPVLDPKVCGWKDAVLVSEVSKWCSNE
jgi:lysophospholipid acyltransferase (LPLAT)-like uncharacterized protein